MFASLAHASHFVNVTGELAIITIEVVYSLSAIAAAEDATIKVPSAMKAFASLRWIDRLVSKCTERLPNLPTRTLAAERAALNA